MFAGEASEQAQPSLENRVGVWQVVSIEEGKEPKERIRYHRRDSYGRGSNDDPVAERRLAHSVRKMCVVYRQGSEVREDRHMSRGVGADLMFGTQHRAPCGIEGGRTRVQVLPDLTDQAGGDGFLGGRRSEGRIQQMVSSKRAIQRSAKWLSFGLGWEGASCNAKTCAETKTNGPQGK